MARSERPLDPDADALQAFAAGLRRLRDEAGRPTYDALARRAHRSSTSLSEAAGGRKLPSLETTLAFVRALGGDEAAWATRWQETARLVGGESRAGGSDEGVRPTASPPAVTGPVPRRVRVLGLVVGISALLIGGMATAAWLPGSATAERVPGAVALPAATTTAAAADGVSGRSTAIRDGADPKDTGCGADPEAVTVDSNAVLVDDRVIGTVELRYSPACGVSWPRFIPAPRQVALTTPARVYLTVTDGDDPARSASFDLDYGGISVYGNVLNSTDSCVWAQVYLAGTRWRSPYARTGCFRGATLVRALAATFAPSRQAAPRS